MCLALRVPDADTIGNKWRDDPKDCLREILKQWLKKCYDTQKHGPPTWRKLVEAVANDNGGSNPALAETIARKYQCEYSRNYRISCMSDYNIALDHGTVTLTNDSALISSYCCPIFREWLKYAVTFFFLFFSFIGQ